MLIVTMTAESIVGVDAGTGQFYWQVPQFQRNKIHANTQSIIREKFIAPALMRNKMYQAWLHYN